MGRKPTGNPTGRPLKNFNKKAFVDLIGLNLDQRDICWYFRDEDGKPANIDTLTRWCKREFGMTFQEFKEQNGGCAMRIKLMNNQMKLSEKSAAMAIWLGKQCLGQRDNVEYEDKEALDKLDEILAEVKHEAITETE